MTANNQQKEHVTLKPKVQRQYALPPPPKERVGGGQGVYLQTEQLRGGLRNSLQSTEKARKIQTSNLGGVFLTAAPG